MSSAPGLQMFSSRSVKVSIASQIRRFSVNQGITLEEFWKQTSQVFKTELSAKEYALKYTDDEGDAVTCETDQEWQDALLIGGVLLKVKIVPRDEKKQLEASDNLLQNVEDFAQSLVEQSGKYIPVERVKATLDNLKESVANNKEGEKIVNEVEKRFLGLQLDTPKQPKQPKVHDFTLEINLEKSTANLIPAKPEPAKVAPAVSTPPPQQTAPVQQAKGPEESWTVMEIGGPQPTQLPAQQAPPPQQHQQAPTTFQPINAPLFPSTQYVQPAKPVAQQPQQPQPFNPQQQPGQQPYPKYNPVHPVHPVHPGQQPQPFNPQPFNPQQPPYPYAYPQPHHLQPTYPQQPNMGYVQPKNPTNPSVAIPPAGTIPPQNPYAPKPAYPAYPAPGQQLYYGQPYNPSAVQNPFMAQQGAPAPAAQQGAQQGVQQGGWEKQLQTLHEMGFNDDKALLPLLHKHKGNLSSVVQEFLTQKK